MAQTILDFFKSTSLGWQSCVAKKNLFWVSPIASQIKLPRSVLLNTCGILMHAEHSSKSEGLESSLNLYNLNMHHPKRRPVELHTERGMFFFYSPTALAMGS